MYLCSCAGRLEPGVACHHRPAISSFDIHGAGVSSGIHVAVQPAAIVQEYSRAHGSLKPSCNLRHWQPLLQFELPLLPSQSTDRLPTATVLSNSFASGPVTAEPTLMASSGTHIRIKISLCGSSITCILESESESEYRMLSSFETRVSSPLDSPALSPAASCFPRPA